MIENSSASIVLTAQSFNPSIFTEKWLGDNDVLPTDSLDGLRIFSPQVAQFQLPNCQFVVVPPKMQISFGLQEGSIDPNVPLTAASRVAQILFHLTQNLKRLMHTYRMFIKPECFAEFV